MAAAQSFSQTEVDMLDEMRGYSLRMIVAVARTGTSGALDEVFAFQQAWNRNLSTIASLLRKIGSKRSASKLVEDGKFGPNTSAALCTVICGPGMSVPPSKASGMPIWYMQNKDAVDALGPPTPAPVDSVLDQPPPLPDDSETAQDVLQSSGSTVRDVIPVASPSPPTGPTQVLQPTTAAPPVPMPEILQVQGGPSPAAQLSEEELLALEVDTGFEDEQASPILTTRPKNRTPWIAAGIGALILGGTMYWWTQRKGRR